MLILVSVCLVRFKLGHNTLHLLILALKMDLKEQNDSSRYFVENLILSCFPGKSDL